MDSVHHYWLYVKCRSQELALVRGRPQLGVRIYVRKHKPKNT